MAQAQWTIRHPLGTTYQVGVYHGEDSGHLAVYVNNQVTLVEFSVKESRSFSFFLDEELYELAVIKNGNAFSYQFTHNTEAETPLNHQHRQHQLESRWDVPKIMVLTFFAIILVTVVSRIVIHSVQSQRAGSSISYVYHAGRVGLYGKAKYLSFRHETQVVEIPLYDSLSPHGFPIQEGDVFAVKFPPNAPQQAVAVLELPDSLTQLRYYQLAFEQELLRHPEITEAHAKCRVDYIFNQKGLDGLGDVYHQNNTLVMKARRNRYLKLVRSPEFQDWDRNYCSLMQ